MRGEAMEQQNRPIVFICHSMGGIVVKKVGRPSPCHISWSLGEDNT